MPRHDIKRVLLFGSFDPLHDGHRNLFNQAKKLGQHLIVVVARDNIILQGKNRSAHQSERIRLLAVKSCSEVDEAILGDNNPNQYNLLNSLDYDILVLGYDQQPSDADALELVRKVGKNNVEIIRLRAFKPKAYNSTSIRKKHDSPAKYDAHLHTLFSDGDFTPQEVVSLAAGTGLSGLIITDHNGLWGIDEAAGAARQLHLEFLEGIEISVRHQNIDLHILGFSQAFNRQVLEQRLIKTREGYKQRIQKMVKKCHNAGFTKVTFTAIKQRRSRQVNPCFVSYDVGRQLTAKHGLTIAEARKLTVSGGACYVPYGQWALSPLEAIELIHRANGVAILAHPGTVAFDNSMKELDRLIDYSLKGGLDGLEINHPFHSTDIKKQLLRKAEANKLLVTGGSDWHGPKRYEASIGTDTMSKKQWQVLMERLN